jgi:hypothetical protein
MSQFICDAARDGLCKNYCCSHAQSHEFKETCLGPFMCNSVPEGVHTVNCHAVEAKICNGCQQE